MLKQKILNQIQVAAGKGRLLFYEDLLKHVLPHCESPTEDDARRKLYGILDDINNEDENSLLPSALVIDRNTGMPGPGFFRKFGGRRNLNSNAFGSFVGEAKKVFNHYQIHETPKNYGVLIDADQTNATNVNNFLQREHADIPAVICRARGQKAKWNTSPLKKHNIEFHSVPTTEQHKRDAADFFLSMEGAVMAHKTHGDRLLDLIYIISGDKDLSHLQTFIDSCNITTDRRDNNFNKLPPKRNI